MPRVEAFAVRAPDLSTQKDRDAYRLAYCLRAKWASVMIDGPVIESCREQDKFLSRPVSAVDRCAVCYAIDALDEAESCEGHYFHA